MAEFPDVAAARQRGYVSVQQNADEAWARVEALEPLRRVVDAAFPQGSHAVLIAVRDWLDERESAPVTEPSEAETLADDVSAVAKIAVPRDGLELRLGSEAAHRIVASTWLFDRDQRMRARGARAAALDRIAWPADGSIPDRIPESVCRRCGGPNVSWHAPSPVWNAVMRADDNLERRWSIVCPPCFADLAGGKGLDPTTWHFAPHGWEGSLPLVDSDGRWWDFKRCLWVEP